MLDMLVPAMDMVEVYDDPLRPVVDDIDEVEPWGITVSRGAGDPRGVPKRRLMTSTGPPGLSDIAIGTSPSGDATARRLLADVICW